MNKSRKGFWPALERLAGGAVKVEWQGELGPDAEKARRMLRPVNRLASTYPCTNPLGCECPHRVEELAPGRWLAVPGPDEGCAPIPLGREDRIIFEVDTTALCRGIAVCLNLEVGGSRTVAGVRAERIGRFGPSGWGVFLMFPGDSARMMREVHRLFNASPDPFILLTPTGTYCSGDVESCLRRQLCLHVSLRDIADLDRNGRLSARPSVGPMLAEFARRITSRRSHDPGPGVEVLANTMAAGFDRLSSDRLAEAARAFDRQRTIEEMAEGPERFLAGLQNKLTPKQRDLFFALQAHAEPPEPKRFLTYAEIGVRFRISKQAVQKRHRALAKAHPRVAEYIEAVRNPEKPRNFSEMSPGQRRRAGIDESYGYDADG